MTKDNNTGKNSDFYALGKKMFDRLNPIPQDVTQIPQEDSSKRQPLTDKQILADETLRYYFGQNGGAGPVSKQGRKIVNAIEAAHGIGDKT